MMFGYDYPLLGLFWTGFMFFIWVAWIILLIRVFGDIFANREMRGVAKALWSIAVIVVPLLGTLLYLIVHGTGMAARDEQRAMQAQHEFDAYVRRTAASTSPAEELAKLAGLRDQGVITEAELAREKARLLA
jgi:asparagine N-glycosylation enzyme membrane subunit Stt3